MNLLEVCALSESAWANASYVVGDGYVFKRGTVHKQPAGELFLAGTDGDVAESGAVGERVCPNIGYGVGQDNAC